MTLAHKHLWTVLALPIICCYTAGEDTGGPIFEHPSIGRPTLALPVSMLHAEQSLIELC